MLAQEIKANFRRVIEEAFNKGNVDIMDELYAVDFIHHVPPFADSGLKAYKEKITHLRSVFSGYRLTIEDIIVEGDTVVLRFSFHGTHKGEFMGISPTNKKVHSEGCYIFKLVNSKIVEDFVYEDWLGLFQQLGVVLPIDQRKEYHL